jgi:hypothetical protein
MCSVATGDAIVHVGAFPPLIRWRLRSILGGWFLFHSLNVKASRERFTRACA